MNFLFVLNLIIAILLIVVILMQNKGSGLSSVFGGGEIVMERRGAEKFIHKLTIILAILFCTISASFLFFNTPSEKSNTNNINNTVNNIQTSQPLPESIIEEKSTNQNQNNNININPIDISNKEIKIETDKK